MSKVGSKVRVKVTCIKYFDSGEQMSDLDEGAEYLGYLDSNGIVIKGTKFVFGDEDYYPKAVDYFDGEELMMIKISVREEDEVKSN